MAVAGILDEDHPVELIRGEIVQMTPIGRHHASCVARSSDMLPFRSPPAASSAELRAMERMRPL